MLNDDSFFTQYTITVGIRPGMQSLVKNRMIFAASRYCVENRRYTLGFPFDGFLVLLA